MKVLFEKPLVLSHGVRIANLHLECSFLHELRRPGEEIGSPYPERRWVLLRSEPPSPLPGFHIFRIRPAFKGNEIRKFDGQYEAATIGL